jgi:hypothetical protein
MSQKNIIVVVDKDIIKYGRQLVHSISKSNIAKASLYSPKQYEDNEHNISGNQIVIFLGENDVSKDYIPIIEKKHEEHGIVWGFDAGKAIIFIDKNVSVKKKDLTKGVKDISDKLKTARVVTAVAGAGAAAGVGAIAAAGTTATTAGVAALGGGAIAAGSGVIVGAVFLAPILPLILGGAIATYAFGRDEIKKLQYTFGIASFLKDGFEDFIKD